MLKIPAEILLLSTMMQKSFMVSGNGRTIKISNAHWPASWSSFPTHIPAQTLPTTIGLWGWLWGQFFSLLDYGETVRHLTLGHPSTGSRRRGEVSAISTCNGEPRRSRIDWRPLATRVKCRYSRKFPFQSHSKGKHSFHFMPHSQEKVTAHHSPHSSPLTPQHRGRALHHRLQLESNAQYTMGQYTMGRIALRKRVVVSCCQCSFFFPIAWLLLCSSAVWCYQTSCIVLWT